MERFFNFLTGSPTRIRTLVYGFGDRYTNHCAMGLYTKDYMKKYFLSIFAEEIPKK
jgi:hypothetical protein